MDKKVVVLGSGYSGSAAIKKLEKKLTDSCELIWISDKPYHFVLHESHKIIRNPEIIDKISFPISEIKNEETEFIEGEVVDIDSEKRTVELKENKNIQYDYLLVAIGSETAYYNIPGLNKHGFPLKELNDAKKIHRKLEKISESSSPEDPAKIVVGGAGLTGIQCVGEIAEYRNNKDIPLDIYLVEATDTIFSQGSSKLRNKLMERLEELSVDILTGDPIIEVGKNKISFKNRDPLRHDMLVWTGGIKGPDILENTDLEIKRDILYTENNLQTSDKRVFATGDSAFITYDEKESPPTAFVAWKSGEIASENIIRQIKGKKLKNWKYTSPGTLVSVGDKSFAFNIRFLPIKIFNSMPAKFLKKFAAARWIANITTWKNAVNAWPLL